MHLVLEFFNVYRTIKVHKEYQIIITWYHSAFLTLPDNKQTSFCSLFLFITYRVVPFLLVEAHLLQLNMRGKFLCLARSQLLKNSMKYVLNVETWESWQLILVLFFFVIQANNAYIFPGFGLGLLMSGAIRVHDDMLLAACKLT